MQIAILKYDLDSFDLIIKVPDEATLKDKIVIESARGVFVCEIKGFLKEETETPDIKFVRIATENDIESSKKADEMAKNSKEVILKHFKKHNPDMKLVDIKFTLDMSKVVISYVCEDRVDFRDLVKNLANELKVRIELRQIGARDQAKIVGCMGICGKECCCKQYLSDFDKVSIKMAKTQNLSLNPQKISGTCGRLMCCLSFENETYQELGKNCPKQNSAVQTPDGKGIVVSNNILKQTSLIKIEKGDDVKLNEYSVSDIKIIKDNK